MRKRENSKKGYHHLDRGERKEIALLRGKGYSMRDTARALGRGVSTISEEINKNKVKGKYDPKKAHHKARVRRKYSKYQGMKIVRRRELREYVEEKIIEDWSPELISGRIKEVDKRLPYVSPKGIYKFVSSSYGRELKPHLAYRGRKKRGSSGKTQASQLEERIFIDKRPKIVDKRRRFGDWEGDFIVSGRQGKGMLLVLHERKARYTIIRRITDYTIETVHRYLEEMTQGIILIHTLTLDNDIIFRRHKELSRILGVSVYFCHPYHSWEKGSIENINKLIRRYIPKGGDISQYRDEYIQMIEDRLNNRPKKCLCYKTPLEVMQQNHQLKYEIKDLLRLQNECLKVENKKTPVFGLRG